MEEKIPHRLDDVDYHGRRIYHITMATEGRRCLLGKVNGNQIIYEHSDGVRYQFFFDKPVKSPSATLTGIAVSRKTNAPYTYCAELQDALEDQGYYELNTHLFGNGNGMLYSPGYKGDRVYCYIYRPNAPDKSPAPRD